MLCFWFTPPCQSIQNSWGYWSNARGKQFPWSRLQMSFLSRTLTLPHSQAPHPSLRKLYNRKNAKTLLLTLEHLFLSPHMQHMDQIFPYISGSQLIFHNPLGHIKRTNVGTWNFEILNSKFFDYSLKVLEKSKAGWKVENPCFISHYCFESFSIIRPECIVAFLMDVLQWEKAFIVANMEKKTAKENKLGLIPKPFVYFNWQ